MKKELINYCYNNRANSLLSPTGLIIRLLCLPKDASEKSSLLTLHNSSKNDALLQSFREKYFSTSGF